MRKILQAALVAASAALLSACASSGGMASTQSGYEARHAPEEVVQDAEYMAIVERVARRRGVSVRWFHPPTKRVDAEVDGGAEAQ